jgi:6-phosphogluconolactonase (cycloisomerase 2 family)
MKYACAIAGLIVAALLIALTTCTGGASKSATNPIATNPTATPDANPAPTPAPSPAPIPGPNTAPLPVTGSEAVLVANRFSVSISAFAIDPQSGTLKTIAGSPFLLPASPTNLSLSPSGDFVLATTTTAPLYSVQNPVDFRALSLRINRSTGALTLAGSTQLSKMPLHHVLAPSGRFLYAAADTELLALSVDAVTGTLANIPGSPFPVQKGASLLAINPGGTFPAGELLYASLRGAPPPTGSIQGALLDPASGAVTGATPTVQGPLSGLQPSAIAFNPTGSFLVAAYPTNQVAVYSIRSTGVLTPAGAPVATAQAPSAVAFDPAGRLLFVANSGANTLSVYSFDSGTGVLTLLSGSAVRTGASPIAVAVSPSGGFVFTANRDDSTVSAFRLGSSGTLTPLGLFSVGLTPVDVITVRF